MKLIVCEVCDTEYHIKHTMDEHYYVVKFCVFCGVDIEEELQDSSEWDDEDQ